MIGKKHREPLDDSWAQSLLSTQSGAFEGSVYDRLMAARKELLEAQQEARSAIDQNPLSAVVAVAAMSRLNRRGTPSIDVSDQGNIDLVVTYQGSSPSPVPNPPSATARRSWRSNLPPLDQLRLEAQDLGIDPASFGRSKTALMEAIHQAKAQPSLLNVAKLGEPAELNGVAVIPEVGELQPYQPEEEKPKRVKLSPALGKATVVEFEVSKPKSPVLRMKGGMGGMAALAAKAKTEVDLAEVKAPSEPEDDSELDILSLISDD